ncbi:MAG: hypothetical protein Q9191_005031 [Dirinaria sp. TL-2023a]
MREQTSHALKALRERRDLNAKYGHVSKAQFEKEKNDLYSKWKKDHLAKLNKDDLKHITFAYQKHYGKAWPTWPVERQVHCRELPPAKAQAVDGSVLKTPCRQLSDGPPGSASAAARKAHALRKERKGEEGHFLALIEFLAIAKCSTTTESDRRKERAAVRWKLKMRSSEELIDIVLEDSGGTLHKYYLEKKEKDETNREERGKECLALLKLKVRHGVYRLR